MVSARKPQADRYIPDDRVRRDLARLSRMNQSIVAEVMVDIEDLLRKGNHLDRVVAIIEGRVRTDVARISR